MNKGGNYPKGGQFNGHIWFQLYNLWSHWLGCQDGHTNWWISGVLIYGNMMSGSVHHVNVTATLVISNHSPSRQDQNNTFLPVTLLDLHVLCPYMKLKSNLSWLQSFMETRKNWNAWPRQGYKRDSTTQYHHHEGKEWPTDRVDPLWINWFALCLKSCSGPETPRSLYYLVWLVL